MRALLRYGLLGIVGLGLHSDAKLNAQQRQQLTDGLLKTLGG